ncbi:hypothetical protein LTS08_003421 [Lithohypha guttulata]|nr:hypothetical protein LTS08_003421 [Lithohypha guttulata]
MAHVRLTGQPAPPLSTLFDGTMYNLGWDGQRDASVADNILLPSIDYAIYLINAVKFHCGQMFHLFDDVSFMRQFHNFYAATDDDSARGLWYVHFLILLAFGKVFVARKNEGRRPLGADFFVQAMKLMPDITFLHTQPVHAIEVLCCKALYLHCLDFRTSAYTVIGEALRLALGEGMHTNMQVEGLDEQHVQRCRNVWWTVYILDRQMSSLMGVPLAVKDDDITASLPTFHGSLQKTLALELNVKLSGIISRILNSVYGQEGRLNRKFISSTKNALKAIAGITDQLKKSFEFPPSGSAAGISRLAAHLHLLHHQCVVLATRPLLFSLLKKRLDHLEEEQAIPTTTGSAKALLQMCIESSQHILAVLERLKEQNLLESFLPFDLEGAFVAGMVLLIAPLVDSELLTTQFPWLDMAYATLDELGAQGLLNARARKGELQQLQKVFEQMPQPSQNDFVDEEQAVFMQQQAMHLNMDSENPNFGYEFIEDAIWRTTFTADQLINVANTLDLDGIDWMTTGSNSGIQEDEV